MNPGESRTGETKGRVRDYEEVVGLDFVGDESVQVIEKGGGSIKGRDGYEIAELSPDPITVRSLFKSVQVELGHLHQEGNHTR